MEIRGADARRLGLKTLSEAAAYTPHWHAGFGYEFMERPDGYQGLVRPMDCILPSSHESWISGCSHVR